MLLKGTWMRRGREDGRMLLKIPGGGGWRRRKEGRMLLKDTWRMVYIDICNFLVLSRYFSSSQT